MAACQNKGKTFTGMRQIFGLITLLATLLVILAGVIACSRPSSNLDETTVRAYADPATEVTLQGLSENDLEKYTRYGNSKFKAAVTQEVFDSAVAKINSQLGSYESKQFLRIDEQGGYTIVHYKAKYAKGEVGIRMVFDRDQLVAGQWFE